jgi:hypothetical protein
MITKISKLPLLSTGDTLELKDGSILLVLNIFCTVKDSEENGMPILSYTVITDLLKQGDLN